MLSKFAALLALLALVFSPAAAVPSQHHSIGKRAANNSTPRNVIYVQTFTTPDGSQLSLLPFIQQSTQVTHVILASLHLNKGAPQDPHLNNVNPNTNYWDFLWPEVKQLQQAGIKVMMLLGGAAQGSYAVLAQDVSDGYPPDHVGFICHED